MAHQGMLLVMNDAPERRESDFCQWCSGQFIPAMLRVPGVAEAWFYLAREGQPKYLQVYYLSSVDALKQPGYLRLRGWGQGGDPTAQSMFSNSPNVTVGVYEHIITVPSSTPDLSRVRILLLRSVEMPLPELQGEFDDWYDTEHLPNITGSPGMVRGCRYRLIPNAADNQGDPVKLASLYEAESREVFNNDEYRRRALTPWTNRLKKYYMGKIRNFYERIDPPNA